MAIVLIAEDEYLVRVGLRTCLDWERHGFILLDDAVNGEDAIKKYFATGRIFCCWILRCPGWTALRSLQSSERRTSMSM